MFYKIFTGDRFISAGIIFLFAFVIWLPALVVTDTGIIAQSDHAMPLYKLTAMFFGGKIHLSKLLVFLLLLFIAFLLVRINARFVLIQQRTFLPALFFIIIAGHSPDLLQWNPVLPAALFAVFTLEVIFSSYQDGPNSYRYFEAGILTGLGGLFYYPMVYLLAFIWIATLVQRPFYWREYLFPVLGLLAPFVFVFGLFYITGQNIPELLLDLKSNIVPDFRFPDFPVTIWIYSILLGILIFIASAYIMRVFQFRKIYIRDYFMVLFWLFVSGTIIFIIFSGFNPGMSYIIAISVSYILTNYFINARSNIGNKILFYLFIGYSVFLAVINLSGRAI